MTYNFAVIVNQGELLNLLKDEEPVISKLVQSNFGEPIKLKSKDLYVFELNPKSFIWEIEDDNKNDVLLKDSFKLWNDLMMFINKLSNINGVNVYYEQ